VSLVARLMFADGKTTHERQSINVVIVRDRNVCVCDGRHVRLFSIIDDTMKQRKLQLPTDFTAAVCYFTLSCISVVAITNNTSADVF